MDLTFPLVNPQNFGLHMITLLQFYFGFFCKNSYEVSQMKWGARITPCWFANFWFAKFLLSVFVCRLGSAFTFSLALSDWGLPHLRGGPLVDREFQFT